MEVNGGSAINGERVASRVVTIEVKVWALALLDDWAGERVGAGECCGTADGREGLRGKVWGDGGRGLCMWPYLLLLLLWWLLMGAVISVKEGLHGAGVGGGGGGGGSGYKY